MLYKETAEAICLSKSFRFIGFVGAGNFKETYHVMQDELSLALKVFKPGVSLERTVREIEAMKACNHPSIGKLVTTGTILYKENNFFYTSEEFLSGGTLTQKISNGLLNVADVKGLARSLLLAIEHISHRNLVHRDIKPDNIMFRDDGISPVLVDFGIVRCLGEESLTKSFFIHGPGTPFYASPEQLNNEKVFINWRTDQFSLGVVLSLCSLGIHPYDNGSETSDQIVMHVMQRDKLSDQFIRKANQEGISSLIKMVQPWPIQRFNVLDDLLQAWSS